MPTLRPLLFGLLLSLLGCDAALRDLYGGFTRANPEDCVVMTDLCSRMEPVAGKQPYCDANLHRCVVDGLCLPGQQFCALSALPICETGTNRCIPCADDGQCGQRRASEPVCIDGGCFECRDGSQCKQSASNGPICDVAAHVCRGCLRNEECPESMLCRTDLSPLDASHPERGYACATASEVAVVDRAPGCSDLGPGTPGAAAFCQIRQAVAAGKSILRLMPNDQSYDAAAVDAKSVPGGKLILIGPGRDSTNTAKICALAGVGGELLVHGVVLDPGLPFTVGPCDPTGGGQATVCETGGTAACCQKGTLAIRNSRVSNGLAGIVASAGCQQLQVIQSNIAGVRGNGIRIADSQISYRIINNSIRRCGTANPIEANYGAVLGAQAQGIFAFNTISDSNAPVRCGNKVTQAIQFGIYSNVRSPEVDDGCDRSLVTTSIELDPSDYVRIKAIQTPPNVLSNAVDRTTMVPLRDGKPDADLAVDYFGTARPIGAGYDYGCHEFNPNQ